MEKLSDWMMEKLVPVANKIGNQRHLAAVRDGLTIIIPATIVGGFAILLAVPPVPASITEPSNFFYAFLLAWKSWAAANSAILMTPYHFTIGIISISEASGVMDLRTRSFILLPSQDAKSELGIKITLISPNSLAICSISAKRNWICGATRI